MKKRKAAGFVFAIIALVAAIVGIVGMYICSNMYDAYAYKTINMMLIYAGTAIVLILLSALLPSTKLGNHNVLTAIFVWAAIGLMMSVVGTMILDRILMIAGLSYIGLGIAPPTPEWGGMLSEAKTNIQLFWHPMVFPGVAIFLTSFSLNVLGDGLRDAFDPKLR